jgi:hypothetical protein
MEWTTPVAHFGAIFLSGGGPAGQPGLWLLQIRVSRVHAESVLFLRGGFRPEP